MSHRVFICAAPRDEIAANAVRALLEAEGLACWLASRDLPPDADPVETARAAIAAAQVVVVIFSARANEAQDQIKRELEFAAYSQTPVLPFRIENVKPVRVLEYFLPPNQFMDAFSPPLDGHLRRLAATLKPVLERSPARPPMPAPSRSAPQPKPHEAEAPQPIAQPVPVDQPLKPTPSEPVPASVPAAETVFPTSQVPAPEPARETPAAELSAPPPAEAPLSSASLASTPAPSEEETSPWFKKPLALALVAAVVIALTGGAWWFLRPGPTAREQGAWNNASREAVISAYQSYLGAWPRGFFRDQAAARIAELRSQVEDAFAKAKAANTAAAYQTFLATYARQGLEVAAARAAYDRLSAEEAKAKAAFDTATAAHTRDAYTNFLADFGTSPFAAEARQKLAACRSEMRKVSTVQNTPLAESGSGSGPSSAEACTAARSRATGLAQDSCQESQGQLGAVRLVSETPQNEGLEGGRILGSIFGAISGHEKTNWKCDDQISVSCQTTTSATRQVDICP